MKETSHTQGSRLWVLNRSWPIPLCFSFGLNNGLSMQKENRESTGSFAKSHLCVLFQGLGRRNMAEQCSLFLLIPQRCTLKPKRRATHTGKLAPFELQSRRSGYRARPGASNLLALVSTSCELNRVSGKGKPWLCLQIGPEAWGTGFPSVCWFCAQGTRGKRRKHTSALPFCSMVFAGEARVAPKKLALGKHVLRKHPGNQRK